MSQRLAVCISKATEGLDHIQAADMKMYFESYGSEEELTADNIMYLQKKTTFLLTKFTTKSQK